MIKHENIYGKLVLFSEDPGKGKLLWQFDWSPKLLFRNKGTRIITATDTPGSHKKTSALLEYPAIIHG